MKYLKTPMYLKYTETFDYENLKKNLCKKETKQVMWFNNFSPTSKYKFISENTNDFIDKEIISYNASKLDKDILKLFNNRTSTLLNGFKGEWTKKELMQLLEASFGGGQKGRKINESTIYLRNYPSGGALYSVKNYIFIKNVKDMESGIYYISPDLRSIVRIKEHIDDFETFFPMTTYKLDRNSDSADGISFGIFFLMDINNSFNKYGILAERLATLEAGHIAENLAIVSSYLNKKSLPICGIFPEKIEKAIGVRERDIYCIYGILFG